MKFWTYCIFSFCILFSLLGCSTGSLFTSYPEQLSPTLTAIDQGQYQNSIITLTAKQKSNDYELYAAELGRTEQLSFAYPDSSQTFLPLISKVEQDQLQAKIQGHKVLFDSASLLSNDNLIPYQLSGYEKTFLYQYQTLNFIAEGDFQNALVSARKGNNLQSYLTTQYQSELANAEQEAKSNNLNLNFMDKTQAALQARLSSTAQVKDAFANAMSYYLSGILFLANGDSNDAAVAFQQAITIIPNNTYLQTILLTTLQLQGAPLNTLENYQKAFGIKELPSIPKNKAMLTVMYEQNFVAAKIPLSFPIYIPKLNQVKSISFPTYPTPLPAITPLKVSFTIDNASTNLRDTELIVNTNALAAKDLAQNYPIIFTREVLRVLAKASATAAVSKNAQNQDQNANTNITALLAQIYSAISDQPDLRSWLTLPQDIQIAQYALPEGKYQFNLRNANLALDLATTLQKNRYYLIWVTQYGKELKAQVFNLSP